jgi:hypothetical protein
VISQVWRFQCFKPCSAKYSGPSSVSALSSFLAVQIEKDTNYYLQHGHVLQYVFYFTSTSYQITLTNTKIVFAQLLPTVRGRTKPGSLLVRSSLSPSELDNPTFSSSSLHKDKILTFRYRYWARQMWMSRSEDTSQKYVFQFPKFRFRKLYCDLEIPPALSLFKSCSSTYNYHLKSDYH